MCIPIIHWKNYSTELKFSGCVLNIAEKAPEKKQNTLIISPGAQTITHHALKCSAHIVNMAVKQ